MTSPSPLVELRDVHVRYPERPRHAIGPANLTIAGGDVVLLLGPSGSGKSTLASVVNGLLPHSIPAELSGVASVAGEAVASPIETSRFVSTVFQDPDAQLVTGRIFDEVAFSLENMLFPVAEIEARTERALRQMGLWARRHDNPDTLSGGGKQRLALACALATDTPVLVLDEPTANLDPAGVLDVYAALGEIARRGERGILLIEHNLEAALDLVTRVVVLDASGAVIMDGTRDEILRERASDVLRHGVWLPLVTLAALRLREGGRWEGTLPLTASEFSGYVHSMRGAEYLPSEEARRAHLALIERTRAASQSTPPSNAPAVLRADSLSFSRGGALALHDVSVDITRGSFTAVIGANGAGKSTLAQLLGGVLRAPRGRIFVGERDIRTLRRRAIPRIVGFVFQNPDHQFITQTAYDELAFALRRDRLPEEVIAERVNAMLVRLRLEHLAHSHPLRLSGGQKRRLSVGTALITSPDVLILDEPTFGQDRERAREIVAILRELHGQGTTVVVVTHDMQLVAENASHIVHVDEGRVVANGPAHEVLAEVPPVLEPPLHAALRGVPGFENVIRLSDLEAIL